MTEVTRKCAGLPWKGASNSCTSRVALRVRARFPDRMPAMLLAMLGFSATCTRGGQGVGRGWGVGEGRKGEVGDRGGEDMRWKLGKGSAAMAGSATDDELCWAVLWCGGCIDPRQERAVAPPPLTARPLLLTMSTVTAMAQLDRLPKLLRSNTKAPGCRSAPEFSYSQV